MTRHARKPAIIALAAAIGLAAVALAATGQFRTASGSQGSLEDLERAIASGKADAATWNAYGDQLRQAKRFAHAAAAYQRSLEIDPDRPLARFNTALSLAQANDPDKFFAYLSHLTMNDPKQAVDLLDRPELAGLHADSRWDAAAASAAPRPPIDTAKDRWMHILDVFAKHATTFSFEFFPPKTDQAAEQLLGHVRELEALQPAFVSVTYGAGGSTRERTHALVTRIKDTTTLDPVPHLTCVSHQQHDIAAILERYAGHHVSNILALGGDAPAGTTHDRSQDAFAHAIDLVQFVRNFKNHPDPRGFGIGVAGFPEGHPATPNRTLEMDFLKAKVDAGADYIVTQLFFDNNDFYDFRERCEIAGIKVPIIAGLMPITSLGTYKRIPELALGARYPAKLQRSMQRAAAGAATDADAVKRVGIHWATEQARDLLDHAVRGIHFYTLNHSHATREIYKTLSLAGVGASRG